MKTTQRRPAIKPPRRPILVPQGTEPYGVEVDDRAIETTLPPPARGVDPSAPTQPARRAVTPQLPATSPDVPRAIRGGKATVREKPVVLPERASEPPSAGRYSHVYVRGNVESRGERRRAK